MVTVLLLALVSSLLVVTPLAAQDDTPLDTAQALAAAGDFRQALEIYDDYLEENPDDAPVYAFRAQVHAALNNMEAAFADIKTALDTVTDEMTAGQILVLRAELHVRERDVDAAFDDLDEAISRSPDYALAYYNRGILHDGLGQTERALADYTQAVELAPDVVNPYLRRARIYTLQDDLQAAIADYDSVIALEPEEAQPYLLRAHLYFQEEDTLAAAGDYAQWLLLIETRRETHTQTAQQRSRRLPMRFGQVHEVPFTGIAGQRLTVTAISRSVDPLIVVYDPDGVPLVADDDSGGGLNAAITGFSLPQTGEYTLITGHARGGWDGIVLLSLSLTELI